MGEDAFKLITNPLYFIDDRYTDWKTRRRAILDLVKDDPGRAEVRKAFADIADAVSGRSIEDYRKRIALEKNLNLDLSEFRRRVGAAALLGLLAFQICVTDFDSDFVRLSGSRRIEASRKAGRGRRKDNTTTI